MINPKEEALLQALHLVHPRLHVWATCLIVEHKWTADQVKVKLAELVDASGRFT